MTCSERMRGLALAGALAAAALAGCTRADADDVAVVVPRLLPLAGPLAGIEAEVSGMSWHADTLIFVPQFPDRFGTEGDLVFFGLPGAELERALGGESAAPLEPFPIPCRAPWLVGLIQGYDGLESVGVLGSQCFMTIEARDATTNAYLVAGRWAWTGEVLELELERLTSIPTTARHGNLSVETILMDGARVVTIGEANGALVNPGARAYTFDTELQLTGSLPMPPIEYRVTDATALDDQRRFWVLNYGFPPEAVALLPARDPEVERFGAPEWLKGEVCIERLLELRITDDERIERTGTPPLWLVPLADGRCRNWEAVVRLGDRGFLLMTDEHPETLLAFVPLPDGFQRP